MKTLQNFTEKYSENKKKRNIQKIKKGGEKNKILKTVLIPK